MAFRFLLPITIRRCAVSCIGRARWRRLPFASVINDLHLCRPLRAWDRDGKQNLKAIAVRGTKGVGNIRDPKGFMAPRGREKSPGR